MMSDERRRYNERRRNDVTTRAVDDNERMKSEYCTRYKYLVVKYSIGTGPRPLFNPIIAHRVGIRGVIGHIGNVLNKLLRTLLEKYHPKKTPTGGDALRCYDVNTKYSGELKNRPRKLNPESESTFSGCPGGSGVLTYVSEHLTQFYFQVDNYSGTSRGR
jgi:hypothetical protein